jgi:uncharacterized protein (TIGR03083 family)
VLDRDQYLATFRRDTAALLGALRDAGPDAPVPYCPGWSATDLAAHIAGACELWARVVRDRVEDPRQVTRAEPPPTFEARLALAEHWCAELDSVLRTTDGSDKTTAFWVRRMAQETAVHRLDAERAAGRSYTIDPELASDGVDEFLFVFLGPVDQDAAAGSVHLHCTDVAGEWLVHADGTVTREHAKGDAAVRGPAADLLLVLWRRLALDDADDVDVIGDRAVAERLIARPNLFG